MINKEKEIWRVHPEYVGIEVSTLGRVRTLDRTVVSNGRGTYLVKGHVVKQYNDKGGYLRLGIPIDGKWTKKLAHRLVAQTFLPNPDNLPEVNHKDCDRKNNNVENLEFCTRQENIAYRDKYGNMARNNAPKSPVFAVNLKTLEVSQFQSQHEAGRVLGVNVANVNSVIKGRYKKTGGFWFTKADENADDAINRKIQEIGKI